MQKRNVDKLQYAMKSLEDALKYTRTGEFQTLGIEFKSILVSAVVQNFGLTFSVCRQLIMRQLEDRLGKEAVSRMVPEELFRAAEKERLIANVDRWLGYLECEHLNSTSNLALRTFEKATEFLTDASELFRTCHKRSHNERRAA